MPGHLAHGPANRGPANRGRRVLAAAAPLFVCEPRRAPRGGAVLVHDLPGLTHEIEEGCRRLAADGWLAVAPFFYHEHGGPVFDAADLVAARAEFRRLGAAAQAADLAAAVGYLADRGVDAPLVLGFGAGARLAAWAAAALDGVGAAIAVGPVLGGTVPAGTVSAGTGPDRQVPAEPELGEPELAGPVQASLGVPPPGRPRVPWLAVPDDDPWPRVAAFVGRLGF